MKKFYFCAAILCFLLSLMTKNYVSAAPVSITVYCDMRDTASLPDDEAGLKNKTDLAAYDGTAMYITGHWSPESNPGTGDWSFIEMQLAEGKTDIWVVTFDYEPGYFQGNTDDDPELIVDHPGWYFAPTNDWGTAEWVPAPCNVAWDVQRIFEINIYDPDTTVAFKYGVCDPVDLCSLDIPEICVVDATSEISISENISIYPNPNNGILNISISDNKEISLSIFDITGKAVSNYFMTEKNNEIDLTDLPSGIYLLKISDDDYTETRKIILK
ncbi:MAG: T9SS type A sorting domain-containing protein [Bacteroidales bacterium]|nr:T9SS type A sorting domain-containing protein [Bacteroidales bacterium]